MNSYLIKGDYEKEEGVVVRVIDGDTLVMGNLTIRLLGINTPEKGERYYNEAKMFLERIVLNKSIELERGKENFDKYKRSLRYIFVNEENVNLMLIENGFANAYFPSGKDKYADEFYYAWDDCVESNKNLCEKSNNKCANCINVKELEINSQKIVLENYCTFECDAEKWQISGEGRKKTEIGKKIPENTELEIKTENTWLQTDTLFLRDDNGKLILYYHY
jgi:hypothetical protein